MKIETYDIFDTKYLVHGIVDYLEDRNTSCKVYFHEDKYNTIKIKFSYSNRYSSFKIKCVFSITESCKNTIPFGSLTFKVGSQKLYFYVPNDKLLDKKAASKWALEKFYKCMDMSF
jgi:hypothetical protein